MSLSWSAAIVATSASLSCSSRFVKILRYLDFMSFLYYYFVFRYYFFITGLPNSINRGPTIIVTSGYCLELVIILLVILGTDFPILASDCWNFDFIIAFIQIEVRITAFETWDQNFATALIYFTNYLVTDQFRQ